MQTTFLLSPQARWELSLAAASARRPVVSPDALSLLGLGALLAFLFRGTLPGSARLLLGDDAIESYTWEAFNRAALASGQWPWWNPFNLSGMPALADPQTGFFYPPYVLFRLLPLSLESSLSLALVLHIWIAGAGTYALCRRLGTGAIPALLGAVAFMLSGAFTPRIYAGHLQVINAFAWLPVALLYAVHSRQSGRLLPHPLLPVVLVVQLLAGFPQVSVYTVGVVTLYYAAALTSTLAARRGAWASRGVLHQIAQPVVVFVLAGCLAMFQALPAIVLLSNTGRGDGLSYEQATKGSLQFQHLVNFAFPTAFASASTGFQDGFGAAIYEKSPYVGLLTLVLAPLAFASGKHRRSALFFGLLVVGAFGLALGSNAPHYELHHRLFPGLRIPGRILPVANLSLAVLAGLGLDLLLRQGGDVQWRRALRGFSVLPVIAVLIAVGLSTPVYLEQGLTRATVFGTPLWVLASTLLGLAICAWLISFQRLRTAGAGLAVCILALDLSVFASQFMVVSGLGRNASVAALSASVRDGRVLTTCGGAVPPNQMVLNGAPNVDGYNSSFFGDYARLAFLAKGVPVSSSISRYPRLDMGELPPRLDLLAMMNVTHVLACSPLENEALSLLDWREDRNRSYFLYRFEPGLPRAFVACSVEVAASRQDAITRLERVSSPLSRVVLSEPSGAETSPLQRLLSSARRLPPGQAASNLSGGCQPDARVDVLAMDRVDGGALVDVTVPAEAVLFLAEPYAPERRTWVDGEEVDVSRANLAFSAVRLAPGSHRVEMRYVPTTFFIGSAISLATCAAWILLSLLTRMRALASSRVPAGRFAIRRADNAEGSVGTA